MNVFRSLILSNWLGLFYMCCMLPAAYADSCMNDKSCKKLVHEGLLLYYRGRYAEALDRFTRAHEHNSIPELSINIGRSLDHLNRPQEAIDMYEKYLRQRPGSDLADKVQAFMKEAQEHLSAMRSETAPKPESPGAAQPPPAGAVTPPLAGLWSAHDGASSHRRTWLVAGGLSTASGLVGLLAGVGCYGAIRIARDTELASTTDEFKKLAVLQQNQPLYNAMVASYSLGAIMLSAGLAAIIYERHRKKSHESAAPGLGDSLRLSAGATGVALEGVY